MLTRCSHTYISRGLTAPKPTVLACRAMPCTQQSSIRCCLTWNNFPELKGKRPQLRVHQLLHDDRALYAVRALARDGDGGGPLGGLAVDWLQRLGRQVICSTAVCKARITGPKSWARLTGRATVKACMCKSDPDALGEDRVSSGVLALGLCARQEIAAKRTALRAAAEVEASYQPHCHKALKPELTKSRE